MLHSMFTMCRQKVARVYRCQLDILTDIRRWIILIYVQISFYSIHNLLKNEVTNSILFLTLSVFAEAIHRSDIIHITTDLHR